MNVHLKKRDDLLNANPAHKKCRPCKFGKEIFDKLDLKHYSINRISVYMESMDTLLIQD